MIRTLRILYLSRPAREKLLVLALLVMFAVWWLSGFGTRLSRFISEAHHTTTELKEQQNWLANRDRIEREARSEASRLDPSRTLDGPRLSTEIYNLANEHGVVSHEGDTDDPPPAGQFSFHSLLCTINGASWDNLQAFYAAVEAQAPYISVESFSIAANKANPNADQLNASLRVSSVEIRR